MAAVVLAAGGSRRMGGASKLLLPYGGAPLVRASVSAALAAGFEEVGVVVGHDADAVAAALADLPVRRIGNPRFTEGLSTSVERALAWAAGRADAALLLLGDEPDVDPDVIRRVLAEWRRHPTGACRTRYRDRVGHPVVVAVGLAGTARGDRGLRDRLAPDRADVHEVEVDRPAPPDIDTPADYREALARLPH